VVLIIKNLIKGATMATIECNIPQASRHLEVCIKAGLVGMMKGSPGIGKSAVGAELALKYNLQMIDVRLAQCDPTDLLGFPHIDEKRNKALYVPMDTFPIASDPLPEGKDGWLLFLDEFNSADRGVQKAAYKLVLDQMVGMEHLHPNVAIIAAGNLDTDNAIVEEMSTALQSRLIHFNLVSDPVAWLKWAQGPGNISYQVTAWIEYKPSKLNTFDPENNSEESSYGCERTWHFVSRLLPYLDISDQEASLAVLAGTVGEGLAREFIAFLHIFEDLPKISEIVAAPMTVAVPEAPSTVYALSGALADNANPGNIDALMQYTSRIDAEYQVTVLRGMVRRNRDLLDSPAIGKWLDTNNTELF
tara:strand:- start:5914 stop:6993 length:1080 start_codon:yes stop_codon:yes gene_type:complete